MLLSLTDWDAFCELRFSQRVSSDTEIDPHISEIIDIERWVDHLLWDIKRATKDIPEEAELLSGWHAAYPHVGAKIGLQQGLRKHKLNCNLHRCLAWLDRDIEELTKQLLQPKLAGSSRLLGATNRSSQDTEHHMLPNRSQQEQRRAMTQPQCHSPSLHCELCCWSTAPLLGQG